MWVVDPPAPRADGCICPRIQGRRFKVRAEDGTIQRVRLGNCPIHSPKKQENQKCREVGEDTAT